MKRINSIFALIYIISSVYGERGTFSYSTHYQAAIERIDFLKSSQPDSALQLARELFEHSIASGVDSMIIQSNYTLGNIYSESGNHLLAIEYYFNALDMIEKIPAEQMTIKQLKWLIYLYNNIGNSYFFNEIPELALDFQSQSIELLRKANLMHPGTFPPQHEMIIIFNAGSLCMDAGELDKAKSYFDEVTSMNKTLNDSVILGPYYLNMGIYFKNTNEMDRALENYEHSLVIYQKFNDHHGIAQAHNNIGEYYKIKGDNTRAIEHYNQARQWGTLASAWKSVKIADEELSNLYAEEDNYQQAFYFNQQAKQINDEKIRVQSSDNYTRMALQYKFDNELKIKILEQDTQFKKERTQKVIFILISVLLLLTFLLSVYILRSYRNKVMLAKIKEEFQIVENQKILQEQLLLKKDLEIKDRQLAEKALQNVQKNEFIANIADQLINIRKNLPENCVNALERLELTLNKELDDKIWKEFEVRFREVHQGFYHALNEKFSNLTSSEKKLASLLRLNLSSKEISAITYQTPDSIKVARSRLRKKMGLLPEDDIISVLEKLG